MWICTRCQAENRDSFSACESCGSPRTAGRFGPASAMGNTARMPRATAPTVREAAAAPATQPAAPTAPGARRSYAPAPEPPKQRPMCVFAKIVGGLLLVLLPLLCAVLCAANQAVLKEALLPLLLPEGAGETLRSLCYWGMAAVSLLLSLLPGLWTILLAGPGKKRSAGKKA